MRLACPGIIVIAGPTAIGKTRVSIALAKRLGGEIVSADSMQVYAGMALLSQAPDERQMRAAKHHMVGYLDPRRDASVADYRRKAVRVIRAIIKRGKVPIIVGGSGLYVKALIDGLFPAPPADERYRTKMAAYAARYGSARLHQKLTAIDRVSAERIHPHDRRRIIRALEVHYLTGRTMTELAGETKGLADEYAVCMIGLNRRKAGLYRAIDARVEEMLRSGVIEEVRRLERKRLSKTAGMVLGYMELSGYIRGEYDLGAAKDLLQLHTRQFAKRQLTWFRADKRIRWLDAGRLGEKRLIKAIQTERDRALAPGRASWKKRS